MKIVIDIDESILNDAKNGYVRLGEIADAVLSGTPLSKGHGKLVVKEGIPQGEWIMNKTSARGRNYTCTNCQKVSRNKFDFCPKCGADMRGKVND